MTDREAPEHACITGLGVVVVQLADWTSHLQTGLVLEVSQRYWRSVSANLRRGAASELAKRGRFRACGLRGDTVPACSHEHRVSLHAKVFAFRDRSCHRQTRASSACYSRKSARFLRGRAGALLPGLLHNAGELWRPDLDASGHIRYTLPEPLFGIANASG